MRCTLPGWMPRWSSVKISPHHYLHSGITEGKSMSAPAPDTPEHEVDVVEAIVPYMPIVLPIAGAVLMFLLAFIAIYMA